MRTRASHHALALACIALAAGVLFGCGSNPTPPPETGPGTAAGPGGGPAQATEPSRRDQLIELGVTGGPSRTGPGGLSITRFVSSPESSPLGVLGVKEGDTIVSCNGQQQQLASRIVAALEGLESRGEPVVLVVMRDGERVRLERTEKLPSEGSDDSSE